VAYVVVAYKPGVLAAYMAGADRRPQVLAGADRPQVLAGADKPQVLAAYMEVCAHKPEVAPAALEMGMEMD